MKHSPKIPHNCHSPTFTRTYFDAILPQASFTKASGFDQPNFYLFHITPPNIKTFLFLLCRRFLTNPLPKNWLAARIHLLYKKGDPHDPHSLMVPSPSLTPYTKYWPPMPPLVSPTIPPTTTYLSTLNTVASPNTETPTKSTP